MTDTAPAPAAFSADELAAMKQHFVEHGYVMQRVLDDTELESLRADFAKVLSTDTQSTDCERHESALQHLGDAIADFGKEAKHYYFHILTKAGTEPLHRAYSNPRILEIVEHLLGEDLIINNASMLAANTGTHYNLGWHRDVIQIPEDEIRDELFCTERHHNSCQINLPLYEEGVLQVVPGSHIRPNTAAENAAFAGTKHYAPLDAQMPGGRQVVIPAGYALFYNNNLIHRGYCERIETPRRTLHMGYHSATRKPTWHFYLLDPSQVDAAYVASLEPKMQKMMRDYLACYEAFPTMSDTWQPGWDGNP